ncbi:LacI family DNA-binding transcriptional regulator [Streptacidiphilus carbonis]|uniref:LacI family DNA-binding transcriptional regulator n=1 Tax=Streptacidiphilus carbonis TaxID=105422 RepID=UPI0005A69228|nr:LacI family DNA-binding transcriptional regulator [Streptacidiphilus carbonis]
MTQPEEQHGAPVRAWRPTLQEVAALAGVSRATASRVVNGGAGVRSEIQVKVRQAVDELGYVPNPAARALMTRRHDAVAVVVAEPESRVFSDPFFARQLRGIGRELSASAVQLVLLLVTEAGDYAQVGRYLAAGHVDGALIFSVHNDDPLPAIVDGLGLPTVYGGRPGWEPTGAAPLYVDTDNRGGAQAAVRHLRERGRQRIAVITGPLDQASALDRLSGYRDVLPQADPALVAEGDFTAEGGRRAMAELLDRGGDDRPDAVFACSDLMAAGAMAVLAERGLRVPEDVAVVGFDDGDTAAQWASPPLTTVRQDIEGMGRLMARLLLTRLQLTFDGNTGAAAGLAPVVTPAELVVRASS